MSEPSSPASPAMPAAPSPVAVPEIDTARLQLRGHQRADFADSAALWGDPRVTRHIGGRPFTEEEVWSRLLRHVGHWALLGYGYWVVRELGTGRFVGEVGLANLHRDLEPAFGDRPEAGWVLSPSAHGRGYATEAVHAVLAWAATALPGQRTVCLIDTGNSASIRVAEKCGYVETQRTTYKGEAVLIFER